MKNYVGTKELEAREMKKVEKIDVMEKNEFLSEKINFQGIEGYMVSQKNGKKVLCEQFIPAGSYMEFCKAINTVPKIINQHEIKNKKIR